MKHRPMRRLVFSLIGVAALCVVVFSVVTDYMQDRGAQAIRYIGESYMSSMSRQVTMHLGATFGLRVDQVSDMVQESRGMTTEQLRASARAREFDYLALYQPDMPPEEALYPILGSRLVPDDMGSLESHMEAGENRIDMGLDQLDGRVILISAPAPEGMTVDGKTGAGLVAGVWASYIDHNLQHELDAGMVESWAVVRSDGGLVARSQGYHMSEGPDFLKWLRGTEGGDEIADQLQQTMASGGEFSFPVATEAGDDSHVYCGPVPASDWYLLLNTSYGPVNDGIAGLGESWKSTAFGGCAVILLTLMMVFAWYIAATRRQLRDLEEAREAAEEASRAKSQFLSNMSHDIRTPLNGIVGMTAIARSNTGDPEVMARCLGKITSSSRHLLGLINDILDMAKIDSGRMTLNMEQVSLREVMQELVAIVQQQVKLKSQSFDVYIDNISVEDVCCDSVRLNQIFLNLLSNAIKFTPDGGNIKVTLYESPSPKGDRYIRSHLQVKDNGVGMSEEFVSHIFESFVREDSARVHKAQGAGVGMAITKHIVDAMGGAIRVKSKVGEGTEVDVILDMEKAAVSESDMHLPNWPMLVVDDDETLCMSAVATLRSLGIHADWATDPGEALEMAKKRRGGREAYRLYLIDWHMPGADGIEVAKKLREISGEDARILLTSAYDKDDMEEAAKDCRIDGEIAKPLFKSTLYYGLLGYMGESQEETQPFGEEPGEDGSLEGRKVIIAEDNDLNWEIAEELLSELGMELVRAENGRICVEMFENSQPGEYDGILMDLRMPEMTGYEASAAIRALPRPDAGTVAIIAMSADAFPEDVQRCLDCGMNAHSAKPIDVKAVTMLLERYMPARKR